MSLLFDLLLRYMVHVYSSNPQSDSRWQIGKQFVTLFLVIGVISVLIISGYSFYKKLKAPISPALDAIPIDAACIIRTNDWFALSDKLKTNSIDLWNVYSNLAQGKELKIKLFFIDSLLRIDEDIEAIIENEAGYFSFHVVDSNKVDVLCAITLGNKEKSSSIDNFFLKYAGTKSRIGFRKKGHLIKKCEFEKINKTYYYAIVKGIFIGSFSDVLIKKSIDAIVTNQSLNNQKDFKRVALASSQSADINMFIHYTYFAKFLSILVKDEYKLAVAKLEHMASWSVMDLNLTNKQLLMNGITVTSDSLTQYLTLFKNQTPSAITVQNILPSQTIFFTHFSLSDFQRYVTDLFKFNSTISPNDTTYNIQYMNKKLGVRIENFILPYIQNEITAALVDSGCSSEIDSMVNKIEQGSFAVLTSNYPEQLTQSLKDLSDTIHFKNIDTLHYKGYVIKQIGINNIVPALFGIAFKGITKSYYTIFNNYLIFSNCPNKLIWLIKQVEQGNVLANNKQYKEFSSSLSEKSNLLIYCNLPRINPLLEIYLQASVLNNVIPFTPVISKFNSMALQITSKDNLYLTNLLVSSIIEHENTTAGWTTMLDTTIFNHPFLFYDSIDSVQKIIAFDCKKNMYMLDMQGQILWKKTLKEQPIGDVFAIDYYNNGRMQYVFNSKSYIYGFDHNGVAFASYPIQLPNPSTGKMTVFDFDTIKEYRYLIPSENKLYNYTKEGKVPGGWKYIETPAKSIKTIKHFVIDNVDILAICDVQGNMLFTDKKGAAIFKLNSSILQATNSDFYLGKLRGQPRIITTEPSGSICYISNRGEVERVTLHNMSNTHVFLLADINADYQPEYVYIDKGEVNAFKHNGALVGTYKLSNSVFNHPSTIDINGLGKRLCIVDALQNTIYLFDEYMQNHFSQAISGTCIPLLYQDAALNNSILITGNKNSVYGYTFNW